MALEWAKGHGPGLSQQDKSFIRMSWQANMRQEELEEIRRQRELETAQRLAKPEHARAEEQAESAGNLRRRAVYLGVVLVAAVILAGIAVIFARQSDLNATLAEERARGY
jgi:Flp pilus assembly protein TadB